MPSESLSTVAGPAGVGSLCILGVFLVLDGVQPDVFPTVEEYAKTTTWGVIAAVPVLVIAYVLGLFFNSIATLAVQVAFGVSAAEETSDIVRVGCIPAEKSPAVQHFLQLRQDRAVLAGSSFVFIILSVGAFSEIANLPDVRSSIIVLASGSLFLAALLFWLSGAKTRESHDLATGIFETSVGANPP
jgi:hypothetical protein